jgi:D-tyrosyl-tRNA(Tyr) deacylase
VRALVQRVTQARVRVDGEIVGEIGSGVCALVGVTHADDHDSAERLADKIWRLRIFDDDSGVMNVGLDVLRDRGVDAGVLVVSQFTLYGDTRKGRRPSWVDAARPEVAAPLVDEVVEALVARGAVVATGRFGAHMEVELVNDGPVTLMLEV